MLKMYDLVLFNTTPSRINRYQQPLTRNHTVNLETGYVTTLPMS
jgi:hypothetical protein